MMTMTVVVVDVLIVGAGPAGLTAAYDLFWAGDGDGYTYNVTVLEATSDIGGRVRKNTAFVAYFDLDVGAEWIHTNPSILDVIVDDPDVVIDVETYSAANTYGEYDVQGKEWYYEEQSQAGDYKFRGSTWYDFWKDYIAVDVEHLIEFDCVVTEIDWGTSSEESVVTARCSDGRTFQAEHAIVTTPLSILAAAEGSIEFVPALPDDVQEAFDVAGSPPNYGSGIKSWLKFGQKFWTNPTFGLSTDYLPDERGERTFYDASTEQGSDEVVLGVLCIGEKADQYKGWSEEEMVDAFLSDLVTMYGSVAQESFTGESLFLNWTDEPYARGAYTLYVEGEYWPIDVLRQPLGDNLLWFAGEGIPRGSLEHGYCHEASKSGRLAAEEIMNLYQDPSNDGGSGGSAAAAYGAAPSLGYTFLVLLGGCCFVGLSMILGTG